MLAFLSDVMVTKGTIRICSGLKSAVVKILNDEVSKSIKNIKFYALEILCKVFYISMIRLEYAKLLVRSIVQKHIKREVKSFEDRVCNNKKTKKQQHNFSLLLFLFFYHVSSRERSQYNTY